tara:strand:+ start:146 stop:247 length:102 start_codon:yes stop_codon:yes gene_type:complete
MVVEVVALVDLEETQLVQKAEMADQDLLFQLAL